MDDRWQRAWKWFVWAIIFFIAGLATMGGGSFGRDSDYTPSNPSSGGGWWDSGGSNSGSWDWGDDNSDSGGSNSGSWD